MTNLTEPFFLSKAAQYRVFYICHYIVNLKTAIHLIDSPELKKSTSTNWADLGCGAGLFTEALSTLLLPGSKIVAVDKNAAALKAVKVTDGVIVETLQADFVTDKLPLHKLDGVFMANALHFVKNKEGFIQTLRSYIHETGVLLIVEYDTAKPNPWVPYPLAIAGWKKLFEATGFPVCNIISRQPSMYGRADIIGMSFSAY